MLLKEAKEFVRIIRKQKISLTPIQEVFLKSIENGGRFKKDGLNHSQVDYLIKLYDKAMRT